MLRWLLAIWSVAPLSAVNRIQENFIWGKVKVKCSLKTFLDNSWEECWSEKCILKQGKKMIQQMLLAFLLLPTVFYVALFTRSIHRFVFLRFGHMYFSSPAEYISLANCFLFCPLDSVWSVFLLLFTNIRLWFCCCCEIQHIYAKRHQNRSISLFQSHLTTFTFIHLPESYDGFNWYAVLAQPIRADWNFAHLYKKG